MRELGILGGTFDPVHVGHLIVAEEVRVKIGLEKVLFMPAGQPWQKAARPIAPVEHRLEMLRLAMLSTPYFEISRLEVDHPGPSYTVDTLAALASQAPGTEFHFILGWDALRELPLWKEPERILALARLVAVSRPHSPRPSLSRLEAVLPRARERIRVLAGPYLDISSSDIRRRVAQGKSIRYLVPEAVENYIQQKGLYRPA